MHRFRRKPDSKSPPLSPPPDFPLSSPTPLARPFQLNPLAALPSDNELRTSLILPSLSRRFTLLRSNTGDPITVDDMRSRFAEQRAKNAEYHISEEEEHLIIEQLEEIRAANAKNSELKRRPSDLVSNDGSSYYPESEYTGSFSPLSSPTMKPLSSPSSSVRRQRGPGSLFASSQSRDADIFRRQAPRSGSGRSAISDSTFNDSRSGGEEVTERGMDQGSTSDYYSDKTPIARKLNLPSSASISSSSTSSSRAQFKRISRALDSVIREIEEEGILEPDDTSRPAPGTLAPHVEEGSEFPDDGNHESGYSNHTPSATSNTLPNLTRSDSASSARPGAISPRIRGYIPGMPRPITPRDADSDDNSRPLSVTPRAQSPSLPPDKPHKPQGILRRGSSSASSALHGLPRSDSPSFGVGRSHSKQASGEHYGPVSTFKSSLHERRRPMSPLSSLAQAAGAQGHHSDVEPSPPTSGHSRQHSLNGFEHYAGGHMRSNSNARSILSPALPDSPLLDSAHNSMINYIPPSTPDNISLPAIDLGSPIFNGRNGRSFGSPYSHSKSASSPGPSDYDHNGFMTHRRSPKPHASNGSSYSSHGHSHSLILSPILNSSQSSLLSTGSSYHSTTESSRKASDAAFSMLRDSSSSSQTSPGLFDEDAQDEKAADSVPRRNMEFHDALRFFGLSPEYLTAVQDKLLHVASPDLILAPRTPTLRRRTNSINDRLAHFSGNMASAEPPHTISHKSSNSQTRANALLDSVLSSIELSTTPPSTSPHTPEPNAVEFEKLGNVVQPNFEASIAQENQQLRDELPDQEAPGVISRSASALQSLADAIFGADATQQDEAKTSNESEKGQAEQMEGHNSEGAPVGDNSDVVQDGDTSLRSEEQWREDLYAPYDAADVSTDPPSDSHFSSQTGTPEAERTAAAAADHHQQTVNDHQLMLDIGRKAAEATAALKSPSHVDLSENSYPQRKKKGRRVDAGQISSPKLVSTSANVNTFTIYSPSPSPSPAGLASPPLSDSRSESRLSKGMRRLRGTLKVKKESKANEVTPWFEGTGRPSIEQSPDTSFNAEQSVGNLNDSDYYNVPHPSNQSTLSIGSPPNTAGPSIKGFLGRLRRPKREVGSYDGTTSPPTTLGRSASATLTRSRSGKRPDTGPSYQTLSPPSSPQVQQSAPAFVQSFSNVASPAISPNANSPEEGDDVKKLFDLATKLGVDEEELSHLIFRSASVASKSNKHPLSRSASAATPGGSSSSSQLNSSVGSLDRSVHHAGKPPLPPAKEEGSLSFDKESGAETIKRTRPSVARKSSTKKSPEQRQAAETPRHAGASPEDRQTVIRRTLIYPAEGQHRQELTELEGLIRKTSRRRRSVGAASVVSARSVHDRAPTPPPPRSKRFSIDRGSPAPPMPGSESGSMLSPQSATASHLSTPRYNKAYDSVYDMYGDSDLSQNYDESLPPNESGPVLQVLELANGETIWSIVNDLRNGNAFDSDDMSTFNRQSFASEFSVPPSPGVQEAGMQLRFKEHKRASSKGSMSTTGHYASALRKKTAGNPATRPETKVFYSSTTQIGRLVESLSKGLDSGSFNVVPINDIVNANASSGASRISSERGRSEDGVATPVSFHSDQSAGLTMEERVERMLNNLEAASTPHPGQS